MTKCFNEAKKWTNKCKILTQKAERITSVSHSVSPVSKALINKRATKTPTKRQIKRQNAKFLLPLHLFYSANDYGRPAGAKVCAIWGVTLVPTLAIRAPKKGVPHKGIARQTTNASFMQVGYNIR